LGKTVAMKRLEELLRQQELKRERYSGIDVLSDEMKELAGLNVRYVRVWEGGTSGLRKIDLRKKRGK